MAERLAVRKNGDLELERGWVCDLVWVWVMKWVKLAMDMFA